MMRPGTDPARQEFGIDTDLGRSTGSAPTKRHMPRTALDFSRADFPTTFVFGVATSAYQIEGTRFGGAGHTHWDSFAATPGNVVRSEDGAPPAIITTVGPSDLDLMRGGARRLPLLDVVGARDAGGHGAVEAAKDSISMTGWSTGCWRARGLPCLTLYHWEMRHRWPTRRLAQPRHRGLVRGLYPGGHGPGLATACGRRADQRAVVRRLALPFPRPPCAGPARHPRDGARDAPRAARHGRATWRSCATWEKNLGLVANMEYTRPPPAHPRGPGRRRAPATRSTTAGLSGPSTAKPTPPRRCKAWSRICGKAGRTISA